MDAAIGRVICERVCDPGQITRVTPPFLIGIFSRTVSSSSASVSMTYVLPRDALVFLMAGVTVATNGSGVYLDMNGSTFWSAICRDGVPAATGRATFLSAGTYTFALRSGAENFDSFIYVLATYK